MHDLREAEGKALIPFLEHYAEAGGVPQRILLNRSPFRIGRSTSANFTIYSGQVSKEHAEIVCKDKDFHIRDLGSTNGTFVNGRRISEALLTSGDIVHLAHKEFRFGYDAVESAHHSDVHITDPAKSSLPASLIRGGEYLRELLVQRAVRVLFQPIAHLESKDILGYEALGRSTHPELSPNPSELFYLAERCKLASELSQLLRVVAIQDSRGLPANSRIFVNVHPSEKIDDLFIDSLKELRLMLRSDLKLVLEVHEDVVADLKSMQWLREQLKKLGIEMAYDDFGSGQARLTELAEVPPDYIKLHMNLIRGIDLAQARQDLVLGLNRVIRELGVRLIAEGLETPEEAKVCLSLGCHYGQGFLLGRPEPLPTSAKG